MDVRRGKLWYDRIKFGAVLILFLIALFFILSYRSIAEIPRIELFILIFLFGVLCCFLATSVVYAKVEKVQERQSNNILICQILFYLFLALVSISYSFTLAEDVFGARSKVFFSRSIKTLISGFYSSLFVLTILKEVRIALSEVEKEYEKRIELIRQGNDLFDNTRPGYTLDSLLDLLFKTSATQIFMIFAYNLLLLWLDESFLMGMGFSILSTVLKSVIDILKDKIGWILTML